MNLDEINKLFEGFKSMNLMVIGDVMLDSYITGTVDRISPEAPVPVVSKTDHYNRLGGAANVALNIKITGANPILCSIIGNDASGKMFIDLLKKSEINTDMILVDNNRKTSNKTRIISNGQHLLRIDDEEINDINDTQLKSILKLIEEKIATTKIDALIIQDYNKGLLTEELIKKIINLANKNKIPVCVDPKRKNFNTYKNIALFKPNFKEFRDGLNIEINRNDEESIIKYAKEFIENNNIENIMITMSELGVFICNKDEEFFIPAHKRDIVDVSGAGDTVISVASLCYVSKLNLYHIAYISNLAGGLVCEKIGVVACDINNLKEEMCKYLIS